MRLAWIEQATSSEQVDQPHLHVLAHHISSSMYRHWNSTQYARDKASVLDTGREIGGYMSLAHGDPLVALMRSSADVDGPPEIMNGNLRTNLEWQQKKKGQKSG
ncbi:hypothetical protein KC358_g49 [Hortaea werneckii]|nr:hypothetical protein KC358_g49 [Hortaea werneckii]